MVSQLAFGNHLPPASLSFVRLLIGVLALLVALRAWPRLRETRVAVLGAILSVTLLVQAYGTYLSGAATGSLLTLMTPVFVALLAPFFLHEKTRLPQWAGIGLGIAGAAVVLYLGLGATALGWWAWYRGVEGAPAAAVAVPFLLQPVIGVGLSALFLGAHLTIAFAAGSALVAAGMLVASLKGER